MLYVAKEAPLVKSVLLRAAAAVFYSTALGTPQEQLITLPADPIQTAGDVFIGAQGVRVAEAGACAVQQRCRR